MYCTIACLPVKLNNVPRFLFQAVVVYLVHVLSLAHGKESLPVEGSIGHVVVSVWTKTALPVV